LNLRSIGLTKEKYMPDERIKWVMIKTIKEMVQMNVGVGSAITLSSLSIKLPSICQETALPISIKG